MAKPTGEYRQYLPDLSLKRFEVMCQQDAHEYAHDFKTGHQPPWLHALYMHWLELLQEPFKGVTTDGEYSHKVVLASYHPTLYNIIIYIILTRNTRNCSP